MTDDLLTYDQAAALIGVSRSQISKWVAAGRLPAVYLDARTPRLRAGEVAAFAALARKPGRPARQWKTPISRSALPARRS
jgi:excisionase family DNA binding protein